MIHKTNWTNAVSIVDAPNLNRIEGNIKELDDGLMATNNLLYDSGWVDIVAKPGYTSQGKVRIWGSVVFLSGYIQKNSGAIPNSAVMASIPNSISMAKPKAEENVVTSTAGGGFARVGILTNGDIVNFFSTGGGTSQPTFIRLEGSYLV